jgi:hypothetical protein
MRFSFLYKLAFIFNCCFLITFITHYQVLLPEGAIMSAIIVYGQVVAVIMNTGLHLAFWGAALVKKRLPAAIPQWLLWANLAFLALQIYYYSFF